MQFQSPPKRILVVRLSALGDVVNCLPAVAALAEHWAEAEIDFLSEDAGAGVLEGHPRLTRVLRLPRKRWERALRSPAQWLAVAREFRRFTRELRRHRYDLVVDLQGNLRSLLLHAFTRGGARVTHHRSETKEHAHLFARRPERPSGRVLRAEKHLHLVRWLGWQGNADRARPLLSWHAGASREAAAERRIYLHPFVSGYGAIKEWPAANFLELARLLEAAELTPVIGWGPGEQDRAEDLARRAGGSARAAPALANLGEFVSYLTRCATVVAADTGPLHLASMAGVPAIGLYGPKDPAIYAPWGSSATVLRAGLPCSPCRLRNCWHRTCMNAIPPRRVLAAILARLGIAGHSRAGRAEESVQ